MIFSSLGYKLPERLHLFFFSKLYHYYLEQSLVCSRYSNYLLKIYKDVIMHALQMIRSREGTYLVKGDRNLNLGLSDSSSEFSPFTIDYNCIHDFASDSWQPSPKDGNCFGWINTKSWVVPAILWLLAFQSEIFQAFGLRQLFQKFESTYVTIEE